ncbi:MAG: doxx family protein [Bacteroidota bacterium]
MVEAVANKFRELVHSEKIKISLLRASIGIIYLWFGMLKFFENLSPAEELASKTLRALCFGLLPDRVSYLMLAIAETLLGLLLLFKIYISTTIKFAIFHLLGTFALVFVQPDLFFNDAPFAITLVGQYVLKNIVFLCALAVIYPR